MQGVLAKTFEHWFASEISIQNYIAPCLRVGNAKVRHFGDQSSLLFFCAFFPFLWGGFGLDAIV
jgi:hypothetical protein